MPVDPGIIGAGLGLIGGLGGGSSPQVAIPPDMQGTRHNAINLLNYFLGFGGPAQGGGSRAGGGGAGGQWPFNGGGAGIPGAPGGLDRGRGGGGMDLGGGDFAPNGDLARQRIMDFFGPMGVPTTDLQRQALGGLQNYIGPGGALSKTGDYLTNLLGANPGQGIIDALNPIEKSAALASNGQGARFSSGNAIAKEKVTNDYNLMRAQAAQQGINQQLQAAQQAAMLGNAYAGAYGVGQQDAAQQDIGTQRLLQLLNQMLQTQQSAAFQLPIYNQPNFGTNLAQSGMNFANYWAQMHPQGANG